MIDTGTLSGAVIPTSTIAGADKIVFLEDGEVRESGSHEELVALPNGHYRRFVELQTGAARGS